MNQVHTNDCLLQLWYSLFSSNSFTNFILKGNNCGHKSSKQDLNCINASYFIINMSVSVRTNIKLCLL
jgi:hypothetical protein